MLDKIFQKIRRLKIGKAIYPALSGFFVLVLAFVFFLAARFLSSNINKAFNSPAGMVEERLAKINRADYNAVAEKLGLPPLE